MYFNCIVLHLHGLISFLVLIVHNCYSKRTNLLFSFFLHCEPIMLDNYLALCMHCGPMMLDNYLALCMRCEL